MRLPATQRGVGIVGILFLVAILGLLIVVALKLYPGYYEAMKVRTSMNGLAQDTDAPTMNRVTAWQALEKRLDINGVPTQRVRELKEGFEVQYDKESKKRIMRLAYEYRTNVLYNVDAVLTFDYPIYVNAAQ